MPVDKPISTLNPLGGGDLPLDPNTLIEVAVPNVLSPTGFVTFKCKLSELISSMGGSGGPVYIAKDTTNIPIYDSGHQFLAIGKLSEDLKATRGFTSF